MKKKCHSNEDHSYERFEALVAKHKKTISQVAVAFHSPGSYLFNELVCDLITHLWLVWRDMPTDLVVIRERKWIYTILYRHALNLTRNEMRHQQHYVYDADLSYLTDTDTGDPLVNRLYHLIAKLGDDDRDLIMRYIAKVPVRQLAKEQGKSERAIYQHIAKIRSELCRLDAVTEDVDD